MRKSVLLIAVLVCWFAAQAAWGMADSLFIHVSDTMPAARAPEYAGKGPAVLRARHVEVDPNWLEMLRSPPERARADMTYGLELNLFDDVSYWAIFEDGYANRSGSITWIGRLEEMDMSTVVLVIRDNVLVGTIKTPWSSYAVRYAGEGLNVVLEIDESVLPPELEPIPAPDDEPGDARDADFPMEPDSGALIDVLVVYTGAAKNGVGGTAAMQSLIEQAVAETNLSYQNSGIDQRLNLVHTAEVAYNESNFDWYAALYDLQGTTDGKMDEVHTLRDIYGADTVVLIVNNSAYCGIAFLMNYVSSGFASYAFCVVSKDCATGYYSFGHELGHIMAARHDWYVDATANSPFSYNHGYVGVDGRWRTVMAYNNQCVAAGYNCTRLPYWSNPDVSYGGDPMGVSEGTSTSCALGESYPNCDADNRKTLNNTAYTVANFRQTATAEYTLSVAKAGSGSGRVTSVPAGIDCGSDCSEAYGSGQMVTLSAAESPGSVFAGWSGAGCSGAGSCVVTMDADKTVTATFTRLYTLSVTKTGDGSGRVTSVPAGIDCGSDCSEAYGSGQMVTLSAAESPGSVFAGWSGAGCSGAGSCVVTMDADKTVTATFSAVSGDAVYVPCGGPTPCFDTIQGAFSGAGNGDITKIAQFGSPYSESVSLEEAKRLTLHATDATYSNPSAVRIVGTMSLARGTIILDKGLFILE